MLNRLHLEERLGIVPVAYNSTLSNGANNLKGFKNVLATSQFEEAMLLVYINAFSATPAGESIKIELFDSATNVAADYATPRHPLSKTYGPTANGGGGETLPASVLRFPFNPGQFKPWIRPKVTVTTTAGTETVTATIILVLGGAKNEPVSQPVAATVLVTPS